MDIGLAIAGLFVGGIVGLTGMGGGALMTPMLVLFFGVPPLAAVSSDLVASAFMKPVGGFVHMRNGTVNMGMVKLLVLGSVPCAFAGVFVLRAFGDGEAVQNGVKTALGVALLIAAGSLAVKAYISLASRPSGTPPAPRRRSRTGGIPVVTLRPVPTVLIGMLGGLIVGMTSVGSGSLIIIALLALYPKLSANQLVGTDLVQAVPAGRLGRARALPVRRLPARPDRVAARSARSRASTSAPATPRIAPAGIVRRALVVVLVASGLKLLGVETVTLGYVLIGFCLAAPLAWAIAAAASTACRRWPARSGPPASRPPRSPPGSRSPRPGPESALAPRGDLAARPLAERPATVECGSGTVRAPARSTSSTGQPHPQKGPP